MSIRYRISIPELVADRFRDLLNRLELAGHLERALHECKKIQEALKNNASDFGESREKYPAAGIVMRIAFSGPISVRFGVHEASKTVFVRSFQWMPRK